MNVMSDWIEIGRIEDIPRQGARVVATPAGNVAIFRTLNDEIFAVRDLCPHKGGPLSQGIVCGKRVACPLHNWVIDLASGEAAPPDEGRTACFPVKLENERLWLQLDRPE
ncbi:nitrite reductase small subunit NirD [Methylocaldum sp.]|jgi:nitrite reductase (NADH) small subunit|uniref:nitrite reductase small subunit NirD n=2 Tax=Methylocaldum TaxID=73778 RepID=UPI0010E7058D